MEPSSIPNFEITRGLGGLVENTKVNVGKLYLRQIFAGSDANQSDVIEPNAVTGLGKTGVINWAIYDGVGPEAELVARGEGMYTSRAGNWNQWFTLVFEVKGFKDSTLQVMGANTYKENEWAIVGGTGEFAMARGIINRGVYSHTDSTLTQELTIEFFCRMKEVVPAPTKVVPAPTKVVPTPRMRGPWGGNGGSLRKMEGKSQRLESVKISHETFVHGIEFSYIDEDGQIRTTDTWGCISSSRKTKLIKFGPLELVKQITGIGVSYNGACYLAKFQIVTNQQKTYGPYGECDGAPFSYTVPEDETVVGFFAHIENQTVTMIGVYTI